MKLRIVIIKIVDMDASSITLDRAVKFAAEDMAFGSEISPARKRIIYDWVEKEENTKIDVLVNIIREKDG